MGQAAVEGGIKMGKMAFYLGVTITVQNLDYDRCDALPGRLYAAETTRKKVKVLPDIAPEQMERKAERARESLKDQLANTSGARSCY
jgi:hypothetical protein